MAKYDKYCIICNQHYQYCSNCDQFTDYPAYMAMYCSQECVDIYEILTSFKAGMTDKATAKTVLQGMNQEKLKLLKRSLADAYKEIMSEDEDEIEPEVETKSVKEKTDAEIATNTVKAAVYENTRESGKNIPRSIAYKNNKRH